MELSLIVRRSELFTTVEVGGELDLRTGKLLLECSQTVMGQHGPYLVMDLTHVTFMGCACVEVLLTLKRQAQRQGGRLLLVGIPAPVWRLLRIVGLDAALTAPVLIEPSIGSYQGRITSPMATTCDIHWSGKQELDGNDSPGG
jgi:anti-sigma B factor antagonist